VNGVTKDIYVADAGNNRVDEFEANGNFVRAWGWGVADGLPQLEVCSLACEQGIAGTGVGQLNEPTFIAVDNSEGASQGDVYVADKSDQRLLKFSGSGALEESWGVKGEIDRPPNSASGEGDLTTGSTEIQGLTTESGEFVPGEEIHGEGVPSGTFLVDKGPDGVAHISKPATITGSGIALTGLFPFKSFAGIAVGPSGNLWVFSQTARMFEFTQDGTLLQEWSYSGATGIGIAVDSAEDLYIDGGQHEVVKLLPDGQEIGLVTRRVTETNGVPPPTGLAVDRTRGDIYVDVGNAIKHFGSECEPLQGLCVSAESFGGQQLAAAGQLAVDSSDGTVYAANPGSGTVDSFRATLEVDTGAAANIGATSAEVTGSINPEATSVDQCEFEYGLTREYGQTAPCVEVVGSGTTPVSVHAVLHGLQGAGTYHYRLVAANGVAGAVVGEDAHFTTSPTPTIAEVAAGNVTATAADLTAKINPNGIDTKYHFEYGLTTGYGTITPIPDADVGAGVSGVSVVQHVEDLVPGATYNFRVVAVDEEGDTITSTNHTFVNDTSAGLPDGRRYELVTPVKKNAALIGALFLHNVPPQISDDGQRVIAASAQCLDGALSCVGARQTEGEPYELVRSDSGWSVNPLAPSATMFTTNSWWAINANVGTALFTVPIGAVTEEDFVAADRNGALDNMGSIGAGGVTYSALLQEPLLATADLSHVVYGTAGSVWPDDEGQGRSLYERVSGQGGEALWVGVTGGEGSHDLISRCGVGIGSGKSSGMSKRYSSLSEDGRTVYFTAQACTAGGTGENTGVRVPAQELYARIDGERSTARTVLISGPTTTSCTSSECKANTSTPSAARDAFFQGASADGSAVVFTDTGQLTDTATQDPDPTDLAEECAHTQDESSGCNLYLSECPGRCEDQSQRHLVDISALPHGGPRVQGTLAVAPDGSHVYFVAKGVLTAEPNGSGQKARTGVDNLYVYSAGQTSFIATLSAADEGTWNEQSFEAGSANVSPDGDLLLFTSHRALTADETRTEGPTQVYEYDARSGALKRISIGVKGFNDNGNDVAGNATIAGFERSVEAATVPLRSDPSMSDDGSYIFFQSPAALTPGALNNFKVETDEDGNPAYAQNVYEYHDGEVFLISDGKDTSRTNRVAPFSVELLGTDRTGANVFFSTVDQLTAEDTDTQRDYYDAHICSEAVSCFEATKPAEACAEGETCHGASPGAPAAQNPATSDSASSGNLTPGPAVTPITSPKPKPKPLTRAQKLAKALKACKKMPRAHRKACEVAARKRYGPARKHSSKSSRGKRGSKR
jgi:hypothetical protein